MNDNPLTDVRGSFVLGMVRRASVTPEDSAELFRRLAEAIGPVQPRGVRAFVTRCVDAANILVLMAATAATKEDP